MLALGPCRLSLAGAGTFAARQTPNEQSWMEAPYGSLPLSGHGVSRINCWASPAWGLYEHWVSICKMSEMNLKF